MTISLEAAQETIRNTTPLLGEEQVRVQDAAGRLLTAQVCAAAAQPPFDRALRDGYALAAGEIADAALCVTDTLCAGDVPSVTVKRGEAVRVMTGAMLPEGADCVVPQEQTDEGDGVVSIRGPVLPGRFLSRRGEIYGAGEVLLSAGERVSAAVAEIAAGGGASMVCVRRRPRAAVIATGSELQLPGEPLRTGRIYASNLCRLAVRLCELGAEVTQTVTAADEPEALAAALRQAAERADVVVTTGGTCAGEKDHTERALRAIGAKILFHGVDMRPGGAALFGVKGETVFLGLSGSPSAAAVGAELLLRPVLGRMTGDAALLPRRSRAAAGAAIAVRGEGRRFLWGRCENGTVVPADTGSVHGMIGANCLIEIPARSGGIPPGGETEIIWI